MKHITWHIAREHVARVRIQPPAVINSFWISVFEKLDQTEILVPTELPVAVDLDEITHRLTDWYETEVGHQPKVLLTIYRYPSGGGVHLQPIGVGLAACDSISEASLTYGKIEVSDEPNPKAHSNKAGQHAKTPRNVGGLTSSRIANSDFT